MTVTTDVSPPDGTTLYAGSYSNLCTCDDGGQNWSRRLSVPAKVIYVSSRNRGILPGFGVDLLELR